MIAGEMIKLLDDRSQSIQQFGEEALACFDHSFEKYELACAHFESTLPKWEIWFEHMLVNHMFFAQFPFQDRPVPLKDEYLALCAVYVTLRFLCLGWTAEHPSREAAADVCAAAFRLIDHTEFDRFAAPILKKLGCDDGSHLRQLLCL
jgi:hypothetical protein